MKTLTIALRIDSSVLINKSCASSHFANCRQLYLFFCTHVPKHMQFA